MEADMAPAGMGADRVLADTLPVDMVVPLVVVVALRRQAEALRQVGVAVLRRQARAPALQVRAQQVRFRPDLLPLQLPGTALRTGDLHRMESTG